MVVLKKTLCFNNIYRIDCIYTYLISINLVVYNSINKSVDGIIGFID
jgi:hypothetical protein